MHLASIPFRYFPPRFHVNNHATNIRHFLLRSKFILKFISKYFCTGRIITVTLCRTLN